jgi:hypothetical protein
MKLNLVILAIICIIILIILLVTRHTPPPLHSPFSTSPFLFCLLVSRPWEKKGGDSSAAPALLGSFTAPLAAAAAVAVLMQL